MKTISPDIETIKQHLRILTSGLSDYDDGRIEIGSLLHGNTESFMFEDVVEKGAAFAEKNNSKGLNVYVVPSLIAPDAFPVGRCSDADFYAGGWVWCDIDDKHSPDDLKSKYANCPPTFAVVTATTPHRRVHLWWKLREAVQDPDTLREAVIGVVQALGGDIAAQNPTRLMRLAGTVNYPSDKKAAQGRVPELTRLVVIDEKNVYDIDAILSSYPADFKAASSSPSGGVKYEYAPPSPPEQGGLILDGDKIRDGREKYMSDMVFAAVLTLTRENGAWPTPQEVFDDVWPVYSRHVTARDGRTLDQDGRGQKALAQKITSKLRAFERGGMAALGLGTLEDVCASKQLTQKPKAPVDIVLPQPSDITLSPPHQQQKILPLVYASDITPSLDTRDFVEGLLCDREFSVIYGESNCGKTFFMLDLAMHVATGMQWRSRAVEQGGVVYAALEGGHGTRNRVYAFKQRYGITKGIPLAIVPASINLLDQDIDLPAFCHAIRTASERIGNVRLLVVDTLARAISGGDENSSVDMGQLVINADYIRTQTGAHIAFIHHSGKDTAKGARGHSSLRAAVDTEIEISRPDTESPSAIKVVKQREMEMIEDMAFSLSRVVLGVDRRGKEVTSCVVEPVEYTPENKPFKMNPVQKFIFDSLINATIRSGIDRVVYKDTPPIKCVSYDELREAMEERGYREMMEESKKTTAAQIKSATQTARIALQNAGKINFNGKFIWLTETAEKDKE